MHSANSSSGRCRFLVSGPAAGRCRDPLLRHPGSSRSFNRNRRGRKKMYIYAGEYRSMARAKWRPSNELCRTLGNRGTGLSCRPLQIRGGTLLLSKGREYFTAESHLESPDSQKTGVISDHNIQWKQIFTGPVSQLCRTPNDGAVVSRIIAGVSFRKRGETDKIALSCTAT
ncbi:hypothetical protein BV22DRAFT_85570 [Leucogyrophana mollusca]|uniref:Uncharacterized protein n=1 Tax=Leucogyrophana mollusca TaxID=85980 RepID=A0ACB8BZC5_9AGAM|nr:hypothetical protein BV22DRAFT_85570 [Leucogyrophana mollusca]